MWTVSVPILCDKDCSLTVWHREFGTCVVHVFVFGNVSERKPTTQLVYTLFLVFELSACFIYMNIFWVIFNYFVIFNYGMCKFV